MNRQLVNRMATLLDNASLAEKLVEAGYDMPVKVKHASDMDLLAIAGVGPVTLKTLRGRFPKVK